MHTHISLWKDDQPLFAGDGYAGLSEMALHAAGGLLKHAHAICAFTNPTTNSYKRLVPGFEAPVNHVDGSVLYLRLHRVLQGPVSQVGWSTVG